MAEITVRDVFQALLTLPSERVCECWRLMMIDWRERLTRDPKVCQGQLCASGTRVMVTVILDSLAEGASYEAILKSYPSLKREHLDAAMAYAAELAREEALLPLRPE